MASLGVTEIVLTRIKEIQAAAGLQREEAVGNILLILALSNQSLVEQAIDLIRHWGLDKGASLLEKENGL